MAYTYYCRPWQEKHTIEISRIEAELARLAIAKQTWLNDLAADAAAASPGSVQKQPTRRPRPSPTKHPRQAATVHVENEVDCPQCCGELIPYPKMAQHLLTCTMRIITCLLPGCGEQICAGDSKKHQASSCRIARRRRKLIEEKAAREKERAANPPQQEVTGKLFEPDIDMDLVIASRNRAQLILENNLMYAEDSRTHHHESKVGQFNVFDVDPEIDERAARARVRHGEVPCPNCGEAVVQMWLQKHLVNWCVNRKIPCRNWELGCKAMVRMRDRANHEKVDGLLKPRSCILFTGREGFIDVGDRDLKPPWTAEYWVYRANVQVRGAEASERRSRERPNTMLAFLLSSSSISLFNTLLPRAGSVRGCSQEGADGVR